MVGANPEDLFCINIKVVVCDDITKTDDTFPVNFRISGKKVSCCDFISFFQRLPNCHEKHANAVEFFHAFG